MVEIIAGINSNDVATQLQCTQGARKLLSKERNPPIDDIIHAGVIPRMVEYLSYNDRYVELIRVSRMLCKNSNNIFVILFD